MKDFGVTKKNEASHIYELKNANGVTLRVTDYGATIVSILAKDKDGAMKDVVLGYESVSDYEKNGCYFGATIGRNSNRIAHAVCKIDGKEYKLEDNDNGNNLHNGKNGVHGVIWDTKEVCDNKVVFTYLSKDMEQDFPGNMTICVTYSVSDEDEICINYEAVSDRDTVANFTNHVYFNLNGHTSGSIENHKLTLFADAFTPVVDSKSIPTGEIASVKGTPLDFTVEKRIGEEIGADFEQLKFAGGYDHNFVLSNEHGTMKKAATVIGDTTKIVMDLYTDYPGVQLYTGNFVGKQAGKENATYDFRHGFCLEPQFFPNAINQEGFASPLLKANETFKAHIKYVFS